MPLLVRRLDISQSPLEVARSVAYRPGAVLLHEGPRAIVACDPIEVVQDKDPEPALSLDPEAGPAAAVPRWIGVLPYEAFRALERTSHVRPETRPEPSVVRPRWQRYGAVAVVDARGVTVIGDEAESVADLSASIARGGAAEPVEVRLAERPEEPALHRSRIERALELIAAGELYQVNLARRFVANVRGRAVDLLAALQYNGVSSRAAAFSLGESSVASISPELLLSLDVRGELRTAPIKGTRPRGRDEAADAALALELDIDPKERAELAMVVDVERNDLGRVAVPGSVSLLEPPHVRSLPNVHHRLAVLRARLRPGVTRSELFSAILPSGSVTGAPKVRAMEVITELEPHRRGLYTGGYGSIGFDGSVRLTMAIRTLVVRDGQGVWFSGGGIVADSIVEREVEETLWKARPFLELAGAWPASDANALSQVLTVR